MSSENIIFNYEPFINIICLDMEPYLVNKDGVVKFLKLRDPDGISLRKVKKTTANYLLEKCMGLSARNGRKYFTNDPAKKDSKPLDDFHVNSFYQYFSDELPLFLDVNQFLKSMLLSSNLLFRSSNLKLCFAAMVDRYKIGHEWTVDEILDECKKYVDTKKLNGDKIRECLDKYCSGSSYDFETAKTSTVKLQYAKRKRYAFFEKTDDGKYLLKLTELIAYYNDFLRELHAEPVETTK